MTTIVGRNCKIEVALTFAAAGSVTALTKANPGVATLNAHGYADGTVGYWTVTAGMIELDGQATMVTGTAANTWSLAGLDTTNYSTWTAGTITNAATWGTLSESAGYSVGGGAANQIDDTRLNDLKSRNIAGMLAAQDLTIDVRNPLTMGSAYAFIENAARNGTSCLFKISSGSTVLRVAYGVPSVSGESVQAGAGATGQFNIICPAWVLKPNV
jgi:hypothetical protein